MFATKNVDIFQLHAVYRKQRAAASVKALRSQSVAEFWRLCVLSGGTQRRVLPLHQSEENENIAFH